MTGTDLEVSCSLCHGSHSQICPEVVDVPGQVGGVEISSRAGLCCLADSELGLPEVRGQGGSLDLQGLQDGRHGCEDVTATDLSEGSPVRLTGALAMDQLHLLHYGGLTAPT